MISERTGETRNGPKTLLGASALTAGVVGLVASATAVARRTGAIPATPEQRERDAEKRRRSGGHRSGGRRPSGGSQEPRPGRAPAPDDPRKPEGPEDLHKPSVSYSLKKTLREFGADQCTDLAAALVYYSVLAL